MINFIKNHFTRGHAACLILLLIAIAAIIVLNTYVLRFTNGYYNVIDILFM